MCGLPGSNHCILCHHVLNNVLRAGTEEILVLVLLLSM